MRDYAYSFDLETADVTSELLAAEELLQRAEGFVAEAATSRED